MTDPNNPSSHRPSITHFFHLTQLISHKETRLAVAKYTTICNEDSPGWGLSTASQGLLLEAQTLTREIGALKTERQRVVDENRRDEGWIRELFRVKEGREESRREEIDRFRAEGGGGGENGSDEKGGNGGEVGGAEMAEKQVEEREHDDLEEILGQLHLCERGD